MKEQKRYNKFSTEFVLNSKVQLKNSNFEEKNARNNDEKLWYYKGKI
jgi:hypothetical protein